MPVRCNSVQALLLHILQERAQCDDVRRCGIGYNCFAGHVFDDWSLCSKGKADAGEMQSTTGTGAASDRTGVGAIVGNLELSTG